MVRRGTYVLLMELPEARNITVGRLGEFIFKEGVYAYVGSAMNGLDARVERHMGVEKAMRWHIDHLSSMARPLLAMLFIDRAIAECELNRRVRSLAAEPDPVRGFGSSDCHCVSHLHRFEPRQVNALLDALEWDEVLHADEGPPSRGKYHISAAHR